MRNEYKYWRYECNMSKQKLADVLYATIMCKGAITDTFSLAQDKNYTRRQNAYNSCGLVIKLPEGKKERWEEITGKELRPPPPPIEVN